MGDTLFEIKRRARRDLHAEFQVPALHLIETATPDVYDEVPVVVRIHTSTDLLGDLKGTNFQYAERHESITQIIFLAPTTALARGHIVSVEDGEAYRIDNVLPPDDEFVTVEVTRLTAAQAAGLPLPEGA